MLVVRGTPGDDNVEIRYADANGPAIGVQELFNTVQAGPGCSPDGNGAVLCPFDGTSSVQVDLGDGDDELFADVGLPLYASGGNGNDRMYMRSGVSPNPSAPATLDGGPGDDVLGGGPGNDTLLGGPGDDGLDGGDGNDYIDPGPGQDSVTDSSGDDTIHAQDGSVDHVDCGPGTDTGYFDAFDVARNCELGQLPAPAPDCTPEIDPVTSIAYTTLSRKRAFTVNAAVDAGCTLRATVSVGSVVVAEAASTRHRAVRIRLSRAALKRIHHTRRFVVRITGTHPNGPVIRRSFSVRVR